MNYLAIEFFKCYSIKKKGNSMITESIMITLLGMGSVFFFLFLLICFMNLLAVFTKEKKLDNKKALAIVLALKAQKGK